jgi:hypothetical protein
MSHTPGDWFRKPNTDQIYAKAEGNAKPVRVASVHAVWEGQRRTTQDLDNGALIAAAPQLHKACQLVSGAFEALREANNLPSGWQKSVIDPVNTAIAKATGGAW